MDNIGKDVDWIIHGVFDNEDVDKFAFHTHGLDKYSNGYELELKLRVDNKAAMDIINIIGYHIKNGMEIVENKAYKDIFSADFYLIKTNPVFPHEDNEEVYRIVLPDSNLLFPWNEGCGKGFCDQI